MSKFVCYWIFFISTIPVCAEVSFPGSVSDWNGFKKYSFKVNNVDAYVVQPQKALTGKPWVFRARFPNFHIDMDTILLNRGVHIAYIDVAKWYGSETAIKRWDSLYQFMVNLGLGEKPMIEAVSRGGLIAYNWAKKNSDKVSFMYLDTPVCDIKSWPGGRGSGLGNTNNWSEAQTAYGMTEQQLLNFKGNPVDSGLESLVAAGVPIYHKISLVDQVVPFEENSKKLVERYKSLGGEATLDTANGPFTLHGHHFPIENEREIASVMEYNLLLGERSIPWEKYDSLVNLNHKTVVGASELVDEANLPQVETALGSFKNDLVLLNGSVSQSISIKILPVNMSGKKRLELYGTTFSEQIVNINILVGENVQKINSVKTDTVDLLGSVSLPADFDKPIVLKVEKEGGGILGLDYLKLVSGETSAVNGDVRFSHKLNNVKRFSIYDVHGSLVDEDVYWELGAKQYAKQFLDLGVYYIAYTDFKGVRQHKLLLNDKS